MQQTPERPRATGCTRSLVVAADQAIYFLSRHWLFFANLATAVFAGLPVLAPWLQSRGLEVPARFIYLAYRATFHQRPDLFRWSMSIRNSSV